MSPLERWPSLREECRSPKTRAVLEGSLAAVVLGGKPLPDALAEMDQAAQEDLEAIKNAPKSVEEITKDLGECQKALRKTKQLLGRGSQEG